MKFEYIECPDLPKLAWCAIHRRDSERMPVIHGPWVETRDDWFHEGAWNGPFRDGGFIEAADHFGTGARRRSGGVEFASPSHPCRYLLTLKVDNGLLISNSLPFLMVMGRLLPDMTHAGYHRNLLNIAHKGFVDRPPHMPFPAARNVLFHACANLLVRPGASATRRRRDDSDSVPRAFEDYRDHSIQVLDQVRRNAQDPARSRRFRPIATISRGYDSTACAALGAAAGWKRALTLISRDVDDDGTTIGEKLGLAVERFDNRAWKSMPGAPEAEFLACAGAGVVVRFAVMEKALSGTLALAGYLGGQVWNPRADGVESDWSRPKLKQMGIESLTEFGLRNGTVVICPALIGGNRRAEINRISTSSSMRPWCVGGNYDRPIPRRLVEERGVPRDWFGQEKMASSHVVPAREMSYSAEAARRAFISRIDGKAGGRAPRRGRGALLFHWAIMHTMRRYRSARDLKVD